MQQRKIILATRNPGKLHEIARMLAALPVRLLSLDGWDELGAPVETGDTFAANARQKARYYASATGLWCLADDSGLVVDALGGRPGVLSARYAADRRQADTDKAQTDAANNRKLLDELVGAEGPMRTARFVCRVALDDGSDVLAEAEGVLEGRIARAPRGDNGFGYDPLFVPEGSSRTAAEMTADEKNAISHRGKAVRAMAGLLADLLRRAC
jgi:XTP/dITP diphosphohydrolase